MVSKKYFKYIFYIITIVFLLFYVFKRRQDFTDLFNAGFYSLTLIFIISLLALLSNSYLFFILTKLQAPELGKSFSNKLSFQLTAINSYYNYILPFSGGLAVRAKYMKDYLKLDYRIYAQITYINLSVNTLTSSTLGIILIFACSINNYKLLTLCSAFFLISISLLYTDRIVNYLARAFQSHIKFLQKFKNLKFNINYKPLLVLILINGVFIFFSALRFKYAGHILNNEILLSHSLIIIGLSNISRLLSITPGNLGIKEGLISSISILLGYKFTDIMAIAITDRTAAFIVILITGYISEKYFQRKN